MPRSTHWQDDEEVAELVRAARAAARAGRGGDRGRRDIRRRDSKPEEKASELTLLFAGLFQTLDRERGEIIARHRALCAAAEGDGGADPRRRSRG